MFGRRRRRKEEQAAREAEEEEAVMEAEEVEEKEKEEAATAVGEGEEKEKAAAAQEKEVACPFISQRTVLAQPSDAARTDGGTAAKTAAQWWDALGAAGKRSASRSRPALSTSASPICAALLRAAPVWMATQPPPPHVAKTQKLPK